MIKTKWYGYKPDHGDHRDLRLRPKLSGPLPASVDLRSQEPLPPFDQGELGSCTANATVGAIAFDMKKQGLAVSMQSRLFLYWYSRFVEGGLDQTNQDSGCVLRDVFKAYNQYGTCLEDVWPYDIEKFALQPPSNTADCKPVGYARISNDEICQTLALGLPVVVGISVYPDFESDAVASSGQVPLPTGSASPVGGHAVLVVGYDADAYTVRNSWGTDWGMKGYFTVPRAYLESPDLCTDLWVLNQVVE